MLEAVSNGLTTVLGWMGTVLTSILDEAGQLGPLLDLLAIGISISAIFLAVRVFKSFTWGT